MSRLFRWEKDKAKDKPEQKDAEAVQSEAPDHDAVDIAHTDSAPVKTAEDTDSDMEEIYSTRNKKVKFRREQPLEAEAAAKRKEAAKDDLKKGKLEFTVSEEEAPEVKLEAELDPDAVVSGEVIEDITDVKKLRNIYVQDIDNIDVSLDPMENLKEYERRINDKDHRDSHPQPEPKPAPKPDPPYIPSGETVVTKIPVYKHGSKVDKIYLKAGRFTDVVESEYDEYLKSTDPAISNSYHSRVPEVKPHQSLLYTLSQVASRRKNELEQRQKNKDIMRNNFDEELPKFKKPKKSKKAEKPEKPVNNEKPDSADKIEKPKKPSPIGRFFKALGRTVSLRFTTPSESEKERSLNYNSREDEKYIFDKTNKNFKKLATQLALIAALAVVMLALVIWERSYGASAIAERGAGIAFIYCGVSLILTLLLGLVSRHTLVDGLKPLRRFKGNSCTLISLAYIGCIIQSFVSLFTSTSFTGADHHLYGFIVAFALLLHTAGRLMMVMRVKSNFDFIRRDCAKDGQRHHSLKGLARLPAYDSLPLGLSEDIIRARSQRGAVGQARAYSYSQRDICNDTVRDTVQERPGLGIGSYGDAVHRHTLHLHACGQPAYAAVQPTYARRGRHGGGISLGTQVRRYIRADDERP